jgi:HD-GYP domain-containing protein (c-di-GMP phosphodiesterase class II)
MTLVIGAVFAVSAAAIVEWLPAGRSGAPVGVLVALVATYALAARVQFETAFGFAVPTQLALVPMLFLAPLPVVPILVALGYVASKLPEHVRGTWHPARAALHLVSSCYVLGPVLVLAAAGAPSPTLVHLPWLAAALAAQFACDLAVSAARGRALGVPARKTLAAIAPAWIVDASLTPLGFGLAAAAVYDSYAFLLGLPLMGLLRYFARERRARIDHALELSHAYRGTALLLGDMVEADDAYTGLHSQDVVSLVLRVSDHLGLDEATRRHAEFTALLHDVGKVRIPNEIIQKPGALTPEERRIIETHTVEGQKMLEKVGGLLGDIGRLVRSCHESWDGRGYPDGLRGEEIPLVARIVSACDAFSAMTTDRPYRAARPAADALAELRRCSGTQFDPAVVDALVATIG